MTVILIKVCCCNEWVNGHFIACRLIFVVVVVYQCYFSNVLFVIFWKDKYVLSNWNAKIKLVRTFGSFIENENYRILNNSLIRITPKVMFIILFVCRKYFHGRMLKKYCCYQGQTTLLCRGIYRPYKGRFLKINSLLFFPILSYFNEKSLWF